MTKISDLPQLGQIPGVADRVALVDNTTSTPRTVSTRYDELVPKATNAETDAGTDQVKLVTPASLSHKINQIFSSFGRSLVSLADVTALKNLLGLATGAFTSVGTAATKDTGTGTGQIPLKEDFGTAAWAELGTGPTQVPRNSDLVMGAPAGFIFGLGVSYLSASSLTTNSGISRDAADTENMALGSSITKTTSAWAQGTGNGGLDTGSLPSASTTSSSSVAIGTGSKSFTVGAGLNLQVGQSVYVYNTTNARNYMLGTVTSYSGTSLVMNCVSYGGSGTLTAWTFAFSAYVYFWQIKKTDKSAVDVLVSLSSSSPVMPAGWSFNRLIGRANYSGGFDSKSFSSANPSIGGSEFITVHRMFVTPEWGASFKCGVQAPGGGGQTGGNGGGQGTAGVFGERFFPNTTPGKVIHVDLGAAGYMDATAIALAASFGSYMYIPGGSTNAALPGAPSGCDNYCRQLAIPSYTAGAPGACSLFGLGGTNSTALTLTYASGYGSGGGGVGTGGGNGYCIGAPGCAIITIW